MINKTGGWTGRWTDKTGRHDRWMEKGRQMLDREVDRQGKVDIIDTTSIQ